MIGESSSSSLLRLPVDVNQRNVQNAFPLLSSDYSTLEIPPFVHRCLIAYWLKSIEIESIGDLEEEREFEGHS